MLTRRRLIRTAGLTAFVGGLPFVAKAGLILGPGVGGGGGTYALVAHAVGQTASTTITTPGVNTTGATLLVVGVAGYNADAAWTITDNKGNNTAWGTGLAKDSPPSYATTTQSGTLWYVRGGGVGSGHTITVTGIGGTTVTAFFAAFSGGNVSPLDQTSETTMGPVNTIQPGSVTPSQTNELLVTLLCSNASIAILGSTISIDRGMIITDTADTTSSLFGGALAYLLQTSIVATNPTWSLGGLSNLYCPLATFK